MAGKLIGIASLGVSDSASADLLTELVASFPSPKPPAGAAVQKSSAVPVKFEGQDGSMAAAGYVLAQAATGAASTGEQLVRGNTRVWPVLYRSEPCFCQDPAMSHVSIHPTDSMHSLLGCLCCAGSPAVAEAAQQTMASRLLTALRLPDPALIGTAAAALGHAGLRCQHLFVALPLGPINPVACSTCAPARRQSNSASSCCITIMRRSSGTINTSPALVE